MIFDYQEARKPDNYSEWTKPFIDAMWSGFWTPNEFDFQSDLQQFKTEMTEEEQGVIVRTLSAIAQIEVAVKKFWSKLGDTLPKPSIVDLGIVMAHVETIHNIAYEKLLTVLDMHDIFEKNLKLDVISGRVKYLRKYLEKKYTDDKKQYLYSLILFTLFVENVSLFSQFYIINWFNRYRNQLKDTAKQVAYTSREETLHALVGTKIVNVIRDEYPELFDQELEDKIISEAQEAYKAECNIIDWILGTFDDSNLNPYTLKNYVANRINDSLVQIGFTPCIEVDEDHLAESIWFDEEVLAEGMTDFFHSRPINYSKTVSVNFEELFEAVI